MRIVESGYSVELTPSTTMEASSEAVEAFVKDGFGLSVHWGLYSLLGRSEWSYYLERFPLGSYRQLMSRFDPRRFDAEEWADLMLEAGARFLLITTKHHDGFCLWDTDLTDFKVTSTSFKRDIIAELSGALRDRGLKLHFYYSLLDWTHPAYREDWVAYVDYYQKQLRELLTRYGPIGGLIFDGYWPRTVFEGEAELDFFPPRGPFDLTGTYNLIHRLQPNAVVANNHHITPLAGEDYQVWELDLPGCNTTGFNTKEIGGKPTAVWWNLNTGWSYQPGNHCVKPPEEILRTMRRARASKSAFLLNVGPRPWGDIHPDEQTTLRRVGQSVRELRLGSDDS